jgi:hypothetical protein
MARATLRRNFQITYFKVSCDIANTGPRDGLPLVLAASVVFTAAHLISADIGAAFKRPFDTRP